MNGFRHLKVSNVALVNSFFIALFYILLNNLEAMEATALNAYAEKCIGKHQIPLDEEMLSATERTFKPFMFNNFEKLPDTIMLKNNGHTLEINMNFNPDTMPTISGGPLGGFGNYAFYMMYLHWLESSPAPNEDKDLVFPAELHLVFYNTNYSTIMHAVDTENGIAIMAYPIEVASQASKYFDPIIEQLSMIQEEYTRTEMPYDMRISLDFFVYTDVYEFFTYYGSAPMLSCAKDVIWIDFANPILLKPDFLKEVEKLSANNQALMRQIQQYETPKGPVFKTTLPLLGMENFSGIPFIDTIDSGAQSQCFSNEFDIWMIVIVMMLM